MREERFRGGKIVSFPFANVVIRILLRSLSGSSRRTSQERIEREERRRKHVYYIDFYIDTYEKSSRSKRGRKRCSCCVGHGRQRWID
jgi:hypothetical protein